ncbi:MAG TPA: SGNH/GDSL hydrolase family protein [Pseudolabrys sp.]|nr:SGNH/GDSL hydrolase family protein [Pseudolabrys sp.]
MTKLVIAAAILATLALPARADPFPNIWVFGDSTVDTGWYKVSPWSGSEKFDNPYLMDSSTDDIGKPTTEPGPISVQELAGALHLHALPQNQGGTNYATSGARNDEFNDAASGLFPNAIPTTHQIDAYLQTHNPNGTALYVISSGGNDVGFAVKQVEGGQIDDATARSNIKTAANKLANKIAALQSANAKFIIVARLPNSFGDTTTMAYRKLYNTALTHKLADLGVTVAFGRVNALRNKIVNNMTQFGITSVSACKGTDTGTFACSCPRPDGFDSAWALLCSTISPVTQPIDSSHHLFADNEHWAKGGQFILGSYYFCLAKHTWPDLFTNFTAHHHMACNNFTSLF